jgi:hypothetical protein
MSSFNELSTDQLGNSLKIGWVARLQSICRPNTQPIDLSKEVCVALFTFRFFEMRSDEK